MQVVVLRGLNLPADAKLPDFEPLKTKTALHVMPLYGANVARVLFTWEAFEPTRGNYSMQYLEYYLGLVEVRPSIEACNLPPVTQALCPNTCLQSKTGPAERLSNLALEYLFNLGEH